MINRQKSLALVRGRGERIADAKGEEGGVPRGEMNQNAIILIEMSLCLDRIQCTLRLFGTPRAQ